MSQLNSTLDKYYKYINGDTKYYSKWLEQNGTECILKIPKIEDRQRIYDTELAFGASTYASNTINYDEHTIHLLIQPQDFTKVENGIESMLPVVAPMELDNRYVIEVKRLNKTFTFEVRDPLEQYWGMLYRGNLALIKIQDARVGTNKSVLGMPEVPIQ